MIDYTEYFLNRESISKEALDVLKELSTEIHKELCSVVEFDVVIENKWIVKSMLLAFEFADDADKSSILSRLVDCDEKSLKKWLQNDFAFDIIDKYYTEFDREVFTFKERIHEAQAYCVELICKSVDDFLYHEEKMEQYAQ